MTPIVVTLPLHLVNTKNAREHWRKRAERTKEQRELVRMSLTPRIRLRFSSTEMHGRAVVTITRIAPRALDVGDNLAISASGVRDGIADALGINDNDPRVEWRYAQRPAVEADAPYTVVKWNPGRDVWYRHGVEVRIEAVRTEAAE